MKPLEERFWSKVKKSDGCWLWTDKPHAPWNYGRLLVDGRERKAHRLSWELHNGPIPAGLCVLHKCDTPLCVRPDHLWLGTDADNIRDMVEKGRNKSPHTDAHAAKTSCPQGHPYDTANTYYYRGSRQCLACRHATSRRAAARRKAVRHAQGRSRAEYERRRSKAA